MDCLPIAVGVLPSALLHLDEVADQECSDVVRGVWGPPMITEFQLWVLSTIVMFTLVIVSVKLPG
jgi:hypothetical protein